MPTQSIFIRVLGNTGAPTSISKLVCPDQVVGCVNANGYFPSATGRDFTMRQNLGTGPLLTIPPLVLVLESPHIFEFPSDGAPGPARGFTGWMVRRHLGCGLIKAGVSIDFCRPLVLMNAVRHMCSAGDLKKFRTKVFKGMWDEELVRQDFMDRLCSYTSMRGSIVINCCTRGFPQRSLEKTLREWVHEAIVAVRGATNVFRLTHPASWMRGPRAW